jgi:hypothetical protein
MDRLGLARVLLVAAAVHTPALAALVLVTAADAPTALSMLCAVVGGLSLPQGPAAMRALWSDLVEDPERRQTAYALLSIVFEGSVTTAPALVAGLAALLSPSVAVLAAAVLASGGAVLFASAGASRRWRGTGHAAGWIGPAAAAGMRTVFVVMAFCGAAFGVVQVAVTAFAATHGSAEAGGLLLTGISCGALAGGLIYGGRAWPGGLDLRFAGLLLGFGAACALLAVADRPVTLAALLLLTGLLLSPTTVVASTLLDTVAPPGTVTEAFTVMVMGLITGAAAGNALGGALVEDASYVTAVLCAAALAAGGAAVALARRRTLSAPRS